MIDIPGLSWARIAAGAAILACTFAAGMGAHKRVFSDPFIAKMQADWAANVAEANRLRAEETEALRAREKTLQAAVDTERKGKEDAEYQNALLRAQVASIRAPAPVDPGMRGRLETARLAAQAAGDSFRACDARARAYEGLLADGDRVVARLVGNLGSCGTMAADAARAHDDRAAEVRALVNAWPR